MLSAVNSTRFASANNYKRTYTNTNQNAVGYQQSFRAKQPSKFAVAVLSVFTSLMGAFSPANFARAEGKAGSCMGTVADYAAQLAKLGEKGETTDSGLIGKSVTHTTPYKDSKGAKVGEFSETKVRYGEPSQEDLVATHITIGNETCNDINADGVLDICFRNNNGVSESKDRYSNCKYEPVMTIPSFKPKKIK